MTKLTAVRVLHITDVEPSNYYLNNLVDHSHDLPITFLAVPLRQDRGFLKELRARGVETCALGLPSKGYYFWSYFSVLKLIRKWNVQVVHTHLFFPSLFGLLASKSFGKKAVMTRHHSDQVFRIRSRWRHRIY